MVSVLPDRVGSLAKVAALPRQLALATGKVPDGKTGATVVSAIAAVQDKTPHAHNTKILEVTLRLENNATHWGINSRVSILV